MTESDRHVPDAELLLHSGGELAAASRTEIAAHVQGCSQCRARLEDLERNFADFARAHRRANNTELPSASVARERLQERLAELSACDRTGGARGGAVSGDGLLPASWVSSVGGRRTVLAAGAIAACLLLAIGLHKPGQISSAAPTSPSPSFTTQARSEEPDLHLTPGSTLPVTQSQVCGAEAARTTAAVPVALKHKVFEEYGVAPARPDAYEVDYLITPELGGATDIRNLWPEPSQGTIWNSYVKDQLEDRLHRMVCSGDVDLATAQRDISTDWIAAYRKYFHTDKPVATTSSLNSAGARLQHPLT